MLKNLIASHNMRAGLAAAKRDRLKHATDRLRRAVELAPANHLAHLHLARVLTADGKWDDAKPVLSKALEMGGDSPAVNILAGALYFDAGDFDSALSRFEAALKLNPRNDLAKAYRMLVEWRISGDRSIAIKLKKTGIPDSSDFAARLLMTVEELLRFGKNAKREIPDGESVLADILTGSEPDISIFPSTEQ